MTDRKRKIDLQTKSISKKDPTLYLFTNYPYSQKYHAVLKKRIQLPVYQFKNELISIKNNQGCDYGVIKGGLTQTKEK